MKMIEFTGTVGLAVGILIVAALLHYLGQGKSALLGLKLLIAGAAFLLIAAGFSFFYQVLDTAGASVLAGQVQKAGIYIGYGLAAVFTIVGALIIALKNLLVRK